MRCQCCPVLNMMTKLLKKECVRNFGGIPCKSHIFLLKFSIYCKYFTQFSAQSSCNFPKTECPITVVTLKILVVLSLFCFSCRFFPGQNLSAISFCLLFFATHQVRPKIWGTQIQIFCFNVHLAIIIHGSDFQINTHNVSGSESHIRICLLIWLEQSLDIPPWRWVDAWEEEDVGEGARRPKVPGDEPDWAH